MALGRDNRPMPSTKHINDEKNTFNHMHGARKYSYTCAIFVCKFLYAKSNRFVFKEWQGVLCQKHRRNDKFR